MTVTEAFARHEGFGPAKNRATRNNNPLNVNWGAFARRHGATRLEVMPAGSAARPRFAYFPDAATGWAAARALLSLPAEFDASGALAAGYRGATLRQVVERFAPAADGNDTEAYLADVCRSTGHAPDAVLTIDMI